MDRWFPLETDRLILREVRPADENDIQEYAADPEVVRFTNWGPNTPEMTRAVLANWLKEQEQWPRADMSVGIELKREHRLIGTISLRLRDENRATADFGYALNRKYWNHGYATEASRAVVDAAFRQLGLHRVWATCDVRNHASYRVMEKLGMRREGKLQKDVIQRGQWRDSYLYAVLADEWLSR
jgi:ribosomal-protein-alanine N-acetyltransferase